MTADTHPQDCHCCHVIGPGPYQPTPEDIERQEREVRDWLDQNIAPKLKAAMTADTQLAFPVDATPTDPHADARRHVVEAIALAAEMHAGIVSPNAVRAHLARMPEWDIAPHVIGRTYQTLRRAGVLVPHSFERSDDRKGGNQGRLIETYRWVDVP